MSKKIMKGRALTKKDKQRFDKLRDLGCIVDKILSRCEKAKDCIVWTGSNTRKINGYGVVCDNGNRYLCHRIIWENANGVIGEGNVICHTCDNSLCCNIDHLFIGTQKDNMADMYKKGRGVKNAVKGHANSRASLSPLDIKYIEDNSGILSQTAMSIKLGVSNATVSRAVNKKRYYQ